MSPNPRMSPIHAAVPSGVPVSASMPILQSPSKGKKKPRRGTPPPKTIPTVSVATNQGRRSLPSPAGKRTVSFSFPTMKESLSDSELLKQQDSDVYAGAKFSEAPLPENLPMPPTTWLGKSVMAVTPAIRGKLPPTSTLRKGQRPPLKPFVLVPCQKMADELKLLLKVES